VIVKYSQQWYQDLQETAGRPGRYPVVCKNNRGFDLGFIRHNDGNYKLVTRPERDEFPLRVTIMQDCRSSPSPADHPSFQLLLAQEAPCEWCEGLGHWRATCPHRAVDEVADFRELHRLSAVYLASVMNTLGQRWQDEPRSVEDIIPFRYLSN